MSVTRTYRTYSAARKACREWVNKGYSARLYQSGPLRYTYRLWRRGGWILVVDMEEGSYA